MTVHKKIHGLVSKTSSSVLLRWENKIIIIIIERFSFECRKTQTKVITPTNHNSRKQSNEPISARAKRGKTRASKSRLVLVLLLIGRGSGARFFNQSQSVAMQNQSNCGITFDTQLKALYNNLINYIAQVFMKMIKCALHQ